MLTQFLNKFRSNRAPVKAPVSPTSEGPKFRSSEFKLGMDESGKFYPDPYDLSHLNDYPSHKQAAHDLNRHLDMMAQIRAAVVPLEGSELDLNARKNLVVVQGLPINGMSVDAIVWHTDCKSFKARVNDNGKPIELREEFDYQRHLKFTSANYHYEVIDREKGEKYVTVKFWEQVRP